MEPKKNNFCLLTSSVFLHFFALFCSAYRDTYRWRNGYREVNYWLTFSGWWCTQASLITVVYFSYKLFKKSKYNYFDKVFDLIVINANIITISIFTISATFGMLPLPKSNERVEIFLWGEVSSKHFWWFYAVIWHYLAPILTITYFVRRKISLAQTYFGRRKLFLYSFFHPLFYFIFVLIRPSLPGATKYPFTSKSQYPYFFFDWIVGNDFRHIIWGLVVINIIFFWLFIFWLSTLFFWWYSQQDKHFS
jgi:hypothetical protein